MLKGLCIGLLCVLSVTTAAWAQAPAKSDSTVTKAQLRRAKRDTIEKYTFLWEKEPRKNMIQWNFMSTFVLTGNFSYERVLSKHVGLLVGGYAGRYILTSRNDSLPYDTEIFATSGYMELKVYPWGTAGRGPYIAPYGSFRFMKLRSPIITGTTGPDEYTYGIRKAEVYNLGLGGVIGYRFILGNWFLINLYLGAGYNIPRFHFFNNAQKSDFNTRLLFVDNYEVRFGMNLGLAIK